MDRMIVEQLQVKGADIEKLKRALFFAKESYAQKPRDYGDSFLEHCVNVAKTLAELNLDETTVLSGILHDIPRMEGHSLQEVKEQFGDGVASLIAGIEEMGQIKKKMADTEVENARKLILASTKDIRVLFLKLAISLENITKAKFLKDELKKTRMAKNIMDIYAPLAHKLGLYNLKGKMEDSAFQILMPDAYVYIEAKLKENEQEREMRIQRVKDILEKEFKKRGYSFIVSGRSKHYYSIYRKMKKKNKKFEELHDLTALRIVTSDVHKCYEVLGIVHQLWQPIGGELDDYIANPKDNMYQSIHTTVLAEGMPMEFQIRTQQMHEVAEYGIAAHWKYKGYSIDREFDKKINWMKQMFGEGKEKLMQETHMDLFGDELFAFTPKGKVVPLPTHSTPIDFAYAIHSDIGDHCKGSKVNGALVPLKHELKTGDIVEILTSSNHKPSREWLKIVRTRKAAAKIRNYILMEEKIPVKSMKPVEQNVQKEFEESIIDTSVSYKDVKFAKCCDIVPGNPIRGFLVKGKHLSVHDAKCAVVKKKGEMKEVNIKWKEYSDFHVGVHVVAEDRAGLFVDIFNTVSATGTKIESAKAKALYNNLAQCSFVIQTKNIENLKEIIELVKKLKSIKKVYISF